jgi:hypothetical protein
MQCLRRRQVAIDEGADSSQFQRAKEILRWRGVVQGGDDGSCLTFEFTRGRSARVAARRGS